MDKKNKSGITQPVIGNFTWSAPDPKSERLGFQLTRFFQGQRINVEAEICHFCSRLIIRTSIIICRGINEENLSSEFQSAYSGILCVKCIQVLIWQPNIYLHEFEISISITAIKLKREETVHAHLLYIQHTNIRTHTYTGTRIFCCDFAIYFNSIHIPQCNKTCSAKRFVFIRGEISRKEFTRIL